MTTKTVKLSLAVALIAVSGLSQATSAWHQRGDNAVFTPEHIGQNTEKRQVESNVHAKMLHGDYPRPELIQRSNAGPDSRKSRQNVGKEYLGQTAIERDNSRSIYIN